MALFCSDGRTFQCLVALTVSMIVQCGTNDTDPQVTEQGFAVFKQPSKVDQNESAPVKRESLSETIPDGVVPLELETLESTWHESVLVAPMELKQQEEQIVTPLKEVGTQESSLIDRILMVDRRICRADCGTYPHKFRVVRWGMCQGCHCDTMCHFYRDCCPDVIFKHNIAYDSPQITDCVVNRAVVYDSKALTYADYQTMVTMCPSQAQGRSTFSSEQKEKCENPDIQDREQSIPVSSPLTGFTYRNIFCAHCHNDSHILDEWGTAVQCYASPGALISDTHTRDELYRKLVTNSSVRETKCDLIYTRPSPSTPKGQETSAVDSYKRLCTTRSPPIIGVCNATGLARYHDAEVEEACALYDSVFDGKYRNMFCYLCNQEYLYNLETLRQIVDTGSTAHTARVSFAALLDFSGHEASVERVKEQPVDLDQCGPTEFFDVVMCECRELQCGEGKYLDSNGTCQSLIVSDLFGYKACFQLDVTSDNPISDESLQMALFDISMATFDNVKKQSVYVLKFCPNGFNVSFYFDDLFYKEGSLRDLEDMINSTLEMYIATANEYFHPNVKPQVITVHPCLTEVNIDNQCSEKADFFIDASEAYAPIPFDERKNIYYIDYTQTSTCTFASLSRNNFSIVDNGNMLKFEPTGGELSVSRASFTVSSNNIIGQVRLCLPDYKQLAELAVCEVKREKSFDDTWTISGLVSIVCTCVSLLCLALTFFTYLLLAPLRIGGGKNIMVLTFLLFTAQALYEFAIEQFENRNGCRAIGVAIHYSWLAAVFSMNACTVERFLKLCYPLQSRSFFLSKTRPFMFATSYSLLCPLVIVAVNIAANLRWRGELGYGSPNLCYITSRVSRITAFAVPMGIVIIANVVLLAITLWRLKRRAGSGGPASETSSTSLAQESVHSNKTNRVGLLACVKLSVVTGITWLLAFLYEVIPYEAISYIITALIGLQGLLFFLSMVINKRVLGLLQDAVTYPSFTSTTSTGSHTKKGDQYAVHKTDSRQLSVLASDSHSTEKTG